MDSILALYRDGLYDSFTINHGLVGEYFAKPVPVNNVRVLCQTRSIYFLVKYSQIYNDQGALELAQDLYRNARSRYRIDSEWKSYPDPNSHGIDLYAFASLSYAECYLYRATKDAFIGRSAQESLVQLNKVVCADDFFPKHSVYGGEVSQNPVMHLFESFVVGYETFHMEECSEAANCLHSLMERHFYDSTLGVVREVLSTDDAQGWFEPGHSFEWGALLQMAQQLNLIDGEVDYVDLINAAENYCTNEQRLVPSKIDIATKTAEDTFRIWPHLERIRAHQMLGNNELASNGLNVALETFFDKDGLVKEYLDQVPDMNATKTTTGYHIINGFAEML